MENPVDALVMKAALAPELTTMEKQIRDRFVTEYLIDHDAFGAALRCGYIHSFAMNYAVAFMKEPYVNQQILERELGLSGNEDQEKEFNKKRILSGLFREANYRGAGSSHSARVGAWTTLAKIHGMDNQVEKEKEAQYRGGVMKIPEIADIDEWEEIATATQEKLVSDARS
jgi:phage terminase small subunit